MPGHPRDAGLLLGTKHRTSSHANVPPLAHVSGQAHHPAWSANLLAHPDAHVTIAGVRYPVVAELLDGEDQQRTWKLFQDTAQTYRTYATRTDRGIRMFSLRRAEGEEK